MRGQRRKLQNAKDASRALARGANLSRSDSEDSPLYRKIRQDVQKICVSLKMLKIITKQYDKQRKKITGTSNESRK